MTELSTRHPDISTEPGMVADHTDTFEEIYSKYYPQIVRLLCARRAGSDAEDIAQEAFIRAFKSLDDHYEDRGKLGAWLSTVAKNAQLDHYRRKGGKPLELVDGDFVFDRSTPDYTTDPGVAVVEDHSRDETLANIVANVTEDQATIIKLLIDGYNNTEIGEILGIPRGTVGSRISRGKEALKAAGIQPPTK